MFASPINTSLLVSQAADGIFPNIKGDCFRGDVSFLAIARMLLYQRLPEDEQANIKYFRNDWDYIHSANADNLFGDYVAHDIRTPNTVVVLEVVTRNDDERNGLRNLFKDVENFHGMGHEPAVEAFFDKFMLSHCWIDFETCRTVIITDRLSNLRWHAIASLTSRYFKKYFNEKPLTEEEKEYPLALCKEKDSTKFKEQMHAFARQFDFRSAGIKSALSGFENKHIKIREKRLDRELKNQNELIERMNRDYSEALQNKRRMEEEKMALLLGMREDANEFMNYFLANKNLVLKNVEDEGLVTFYVTTPLSNFNSELMEIILDNPDRGRSVNMYTDARDTGVSVEDRDLLFKALMVDQTIKVWMFGKFAIDPGSYDRPVQAFSSFDKPDEMEDACPNPHLYYHACMGGNQRAAIEAINTGDYVLTVEQCIGAAASVNINETVTSGPWMADLLCDKHGRIFELPDGKRVNFTDVMKYLKEEAK